MGDQFRSKVEQYSPKSSPRGARSPVVSRQDSTGTLKTTISLGKNPSIVHSGPFYLMKEPPGKPSLSFSFFVLSRSACKRFHPTCMNFQGKVNSRGLQIWWHIITSSIPTANSVVRNWRNNSRRFCPIFLVSLTRLVTKTIGKMTKAQIILYQIEPSLLPTLVRFVLQFVEICDREASNLWKRTSTAHERATCWFSSASWTCESFYSFDLVWFFFLTEWILHIIRLFQLPEQYRYINQAPQRKHKNKHKKHKHKPGETQGGQETTATDIGGPDTHEKKHKKQRKHDEEKERKKRKKEKKRKKQKHSPEHPGGLTPSQHSNTWSSTFPFRLNLLINWYRTFFAIRNQRTSFIQTPRSIKSPTMTLKSN